jgi:hypothetical protein
VTRLQVLALVVAILSTNYGGGWLALVAMGCLAVDMLPERKPKTPAVRKHAGPTPPTRPSPTMGMP